MWDHFEEIFIDFSFQPDQIEWISGGLVLSPEHWIRLMVHLHSRESEIEPHVRNTHY